MTVRQVWLAIRESIRANIEKHGRCVQAVGGSETDPPGLQPFMYTIGNHALQLPELLIIGTAKPSFAGILNRLSDIQRDRGRAFEHEELVSVGGKFPLRIIDTGELGHRKFASFARIYYASETVEVRQVLLPDTRGRWPDTPGCDAPYRDQPILSDRKPATN